VSRLGSTSQVTVLYRLLLSGGISISAGRYGAGLSAILPMGYTSNFTKSRGNVAGCAIRKLRMHASVLAIRIYIILTMFPVRFMSILSIFAARSKSG